MGACSQVSCVDTHETHTHTPQKCLVTQLYRHANMDSCVLCIQKYAQAHVQRLQRRAQTCSHIQTRTHTYARAYTQRMQIEKFQAKPRRRERV